MSLVRCTRVRIRADRVAEFSAVAADEVLALLREQPGCRQAHAMLRGETGVIMSMWETEAQMREYEAGKFLTLVKRLALVTADIPYVEVFREVGADRVSDPSGSPDIR